jgi:hypothetical protein
MGSKFLGEELLATEPLTVANSRLNDEIASHICKNSSNLLSGILTLLPNFLMNVILDVNNGNGKFEPAFVHPDLAGKNAQTFTIETESVSWTAGSTELIPVNGIVVLGKSNDYAANKTDTSLNIVGAWPKNASTGGSVLIKPIPAWLDLNNTNGVNVITKEALTEKELTTDVSKAIVRTTYEKIKKQTAAGKVNKLLEEWAKMHYYINAFGDSVARLICPLNYTITPGKLVTVIAKGSGVRLFKGFITDVTHDVIISDKSGSAKTTVVLNYITPA